MAPQVSPVNHQAAHAAFGSPSIDLASDEEILHITTRHWISAVIPIGATALVFLLSLGLAIFRAFGGQLFVAAAAMPYEAPDGVSYALMLIIGGLVLYALMPSKAKNHQRHRIIMIVSALVIAGVLYFRHQGGRLLVFDPINAHPFDIFNILLQIIVILCVPVAYAFYLDWRETEFILTSQRVILHHQFLIFHREQYQLAVTDVQNVQTKTDTYLQHWFGYGTIVVQSSSSRNNLSFHGALNPKEMQQKIISEVQQRRRTKREVDIEGWIDERIYGNRRQKKRREIKLRQSHTPKPVRHWMGTANPDIRADGTIVWRKHGVFGIVAIAKPTAMLVVGLIACVITNRVGVLLGMWVPIAYLLVLIVYLLWAAWELEDYRNDLYILSPTSVIDIDKKPFGPEDRRTASLNAIVNVTLKTNLISDVLGYGDVVLDTAGQGGSFTFYQVPRPRDVIMTINEYLQDFKKGDVRIDPAELLSTYHRMESRRRQAAEAAAQQAAQPNQTSTFDAPLVAPGTASSSASPAEQRAT